MAIDPQRVTQLLQDAFNTAPVYIKEFIQSGKFEEFMGETTTKYKLHVDVADHVSNEILLMVLGFSSPDEFYNRLLAMEGLEIEVIPDLLTDVNDKILVPLRDTLRTAPAPTPAPAPVAAPQPVQPPVPVSPPTPPLAPPPSYSAPIMPPPVPQPPHQDAAGSVRTMATDMQAVKDHRLPEPLPYRYDAPREVMPPVVPSPMPSAPPPVPVVPPIETTPPSQPARTVPPPSNLPGVPLTKEYAVDPYRESIE